MSNNDTDITPTEIALGEMNANLAGIKKLLEDIDWKIWKYLEDTKVEEDKE